MSPRRLKVGDIVFHSHWEICIWEITDLRKSDRLLRDLDGHSIATLKLLGGYALPPDWGETIHAGIKLLVPAAQFLTEMEILAMAALDCRPD